jgi:predicted flap endonuclease-1-like 5' DNA nuclease
MNVVLWILVGVVIGWLIEWVIDWLFWRKDDAQIQDKSNEAELTELRQKLASAQQEASAYQSRLVEADQTIEALRAELNKLRLPPIPAAEDKLEDIKGIGAVFARKLKSAGITTFDQLARTPAERIREIIQPEEWQKIEPEVWITEAETMAAQKAAKAAR